MHIVDTETASLQGGLVELAYIEVDDDLKVVDEFCVRINPERPIEPGAFAAHGISDAEVAGCPTMAEIAAAHDLMKITHFAGHNSAFDLRMLKGYVNPTYTLCTLALARQYITGTTNHKLETLKNELSFPDQKSHSALGDVYTTLDLLRYILPKAGASVETLFKRADQPKIVHRMAFGRYKGVLMTKVPPDYRAWLLGQENLDKDLRYTLEKLK